MTFLEIIALWFLVAVGLFVVGPTVGQILNRFLKIEK